MVSALKHGVIVVGGGIMGAASAYWLTRLNRPVTILDQYDIPNPHGASGDHLRVFRLTYGKDAFYTELAAKSLAMWLELNAETHEELLKQNGVLELATETDGYEAQSEKVLKENGIAVTRIDKASLKRHYPMMNSRAIKFGLFHKDGGMLWAMRATQALMHLVQKKGAKLKPHTRIVSIQFDKDGISGLKDEHGKLWQGDTYLFTPGAWTTELLKKFKIPLKVTRQQQLYIRPPTNRGRYRPEHFPVFAALSKGFYGFPLHIHGFMKIGDHTKGPPGEPGTDANPETNLQFVKKCRSFLNRFIPELADFTDMEYKIGHYTNTKDDDFIIDRLPDAANAYIATGFSGHGFKFAPLIGKTMAELIVGGKSELNLHRFRLSRFKK